MPLPESITQIFKRKQKCACWFCPGTRTSGGGEEAFILPCTFEEPCKPEDNNSNRICSDVPIQKKILRSCKEGIHWVGKVVDWEVVKRKEIKGIVPEPHKEERDYVRFTVEEWIPLKPHIALGGRGINTVLYTSKYVLDRALEIAELRLETEEDLREWREKRRKGRVKVKVDHEQFVDLGKVVEVRNI